MISKPKKINYNSFSKAVIDILIENNVNHIFTTLSATNEHQKHNRLVNRSFLLNSANFNYLNGMINGGTNIFNKIFFKKK